VLAGALCITSGVNADGTDLRAGRYTDLGSLLRHQKQETDSQRDQASALAAEVTRLSAQVKDDSVQQVTAAADELRMPAGLTAVHGPAIQVTLTDAPDDVIASADTNVNDLLVHQQDIQAVVNALWAGGAEAMTIQDQRVISTTGIKCVGNTVRLHGVPYSPPYVIVAVGDPNAMLTSLDDSAYLDIYRQYVEKWQLGYEVEALADVTLPGYQGSLELDYARPAGVSANGPQDSDL
jgi:uncharacterized protein YlxW (UPF0749 family)